MSIVIDGKSTTIYNVYDKIWIVEKLFGEWLREQMRIKKLSQADLARASGLTPQVISKYVNNKGSKPDVDALKDIAHGLDIEIDDIYREVGFLPPVGEYTRIKARIMYLFDQLPPDQQQQAIDYIEYLVNKSGGGVAKIDSRTT